MGKYFRDLLRNEQGATTIEYALIGGLVCIAIITGAGTFGNALNAKFTDVATSVTSAL